MVFFITSITYDVPQECTWEIAIDENGAADSSVKELPHMIIVSNLAFVPIHRFLPQKPNDANNPISAGVRFFPFVRTIFEEFICT